MRASKIILIVNIIILILAIPGFIVLNNYLEHSNLDPNNTAVSPSPDTGSNANQTVAPDATMSQGNTDDEDWTAIRPNEIDIAKECLPSSHNFKWDILKDSQKLDAFLRNDTVVFESPKKYNEIEGVTTFRGNNFRDSASYGFANVREEKLEKVWSIKIGYIDIWTGVGWNGQPSIVKWDDSLRRKMNLFQDKKNKDGLKEVIYATLDGKIYFLDLEDGSHTRNPINVGASLKGSVTVDPRGYPLLYSGQGIDEVEGQKVPIGFRIYSLLDQKLLHFINGIDNTSFRYWGAFDSTPLLHKETDNLFLCGENGFLYSIKLNTDFSPSQPAISIKPDITKYRYTSPVNGRLGIENAIAAFKNFGYFADNSGTLQCIDLNTLSPVWVRNITDDTDSTMVIEDLGGSDVFLYIANEVDLQGDDGYSFVRKINALTGSLIWEKKYKCFYNVDTNGGVMASPAIGKNEISNLVIFSIARSNTKSGGKLIAFDKNTGDEVWVIDSNFYSWSSPVVVYTEDGKAYIIYCDSGGYMNLIEGKSGKILDKIPLAANIEGSPAVYNDMIVIGTRGQQIWGIKIK